MLGARHGGKEQGLLEQADGSREDTVNSGVAIHVVADLEREQTVDPLKEVWGSCDSRPERLKDRGIVYELKERLRRNAIL